jgi:hypothetical protein
VTLRRVVPLFLLASLLVPAGAAHAGPGPTPVLAYYYIWYAPSSWSRAKSDYPVLGRYSSNDTAVMARHVHWAQSAGITGFVVSWKNTPALDARLKKLIAVADRFNFKLEIIYEGLDFSRNPLEVRRVASDLRYFIAHFANDKAFDLYSKPLVVWSGTWRFTRAQVRSVTQGVRGRLLVLASEKNVQGYLRLAGDVDGDAYYWSSIDPIKHPRYVDKLVQMGNAVHARSGLWIAPAAAGFDARLVGGHIVVPRRNGETLRAALNGALTSSPDAIGLISWNEFSENSAVEPSTRYGFTSLKVLTDVLGGAAPHIQDFSSDNASHTQGSYGIWIAAGAGVAILALLAVVFLRAGRSPSSGVRGAPRTGIDD